MLLVNWSEVNDELTLLLMRLDAQNHPQPEKFDEWVRDGNCPYNGFKIQRIVNFREKKGIWSSGPTITCYKAMKLLIREKCRDSDYHDTHLDE